jgi:raffinose synthase
VFTVVPVKHLPNGPPFAPIGLIRMFNSGGAVKEVGYGKDADVQLKVCGSGTVGAYSSTTIALHSESVEFSYDDTCGLVTFELGMPVQELYLWTVSI